MGLLAAGALCAAALLPDGAPELTQDAPPATGDGPAEPGRVTRDGTRLLLDGEPFRFVGFNSYVMTGCGTPPERLDGQRRERFFAGLRPGSVVRVPFYPGTDRTEFREVVDTARAHGQHLVPVLTDALGECGDTEKDRGWYAGGFRETYLPWLRAVVGSYRDEPTIAAWELVNEPNGVDVPTLRAFFDEAGGLVHRLSPEHLVSGGTLQPHTYGGVPEFTELSSSAGLDLVSVHEYDAVPYPSWHVEDAVQAARAVDKPVLVGEWGVVAGATGDAARDGGDPGPCLTFAARADLAQAKLTGYLAIPEVAGALVWSFTGDPHTECTLNTFEGDPLLDVVRSVELPD